MKRRSLVLAVAALVALPFHALTAQSEATPITGKWAVTIEWPSGGRGTPTMLLKQENETLTGRYLSPLLGESDLKGTVKGTSVAFTVSGQSESNKVEVTFTGKYDGQGTIKGACSTKGLGEGTFTAVRQ